jgi:hypothetical protein
MADKPNQSPVDATRQHYRLATGKPVNQPVPATPKTPA